MLRTVPYKNKKIQTNKDQKIYCLFFTIIVHKTQSNQYWRMTITVLFCTVRSALVGTE
jgi:hypothetical protein